MLCSCAHAAVVTYTLSLNEGPTGQCQPNSFALYASDSKGDNPGLAGFLVDMNGAADGGANLTSLINRSPWGTFDVDPADPDYDPDVPYATYAAGFGSTRTNQLNDAIVSGLQRGSTGFQIIPVGGFGQTAGDMSTIHPPPARNPNGTLVSYQNYHPVGNIDVRYGTSGTLLPAGSLRIATGAWSGAVAPSFDPQSLDNRSLVWSSSSLQSDTLARSLYRTMDFCAPRPLASVSLTNSIPPGSNNETAGGAIIVSGSNGNYVSEVDEQNYAQMFPASAPVQSIGDESGNVYVMAKLTGSASDIAAVLAALDQDVDSSDPSFAQLHAEYDAQFGGGGFNGLFRFPNIAGPKVFNWDFGYPVAIDQLAVVPEPGGVMILLASVALWRRQRG
jgi:hypothetical protein